MAKRRIIFAGVGPLRAPGHHVAAREALFKGKGSKRPPAHATDALLSFAGS